MVRRLAAFVMFLGAALLLAPICVAQADSPAPAPTTVQQAESEMIELTSNSGSAHCSALLRSRAFASRPAVRFDMEQVRLTGWTKFWEPYVQAETIETRTGPNLLEFILVGELDKSNFKPGEAGHETPIPYRMKLTFTAEKYRVKVRGEMLELGANRTLAGFSPCMSSEGMRLENTPPFEAAHQGFGFFADGGFAWMSDGLRWRSESHPGEQPGPWNGIEGPWIGMFPVARRTDPRSLAAPIVGWVAADNSYMIAAASRHGYQAGLRWTPCLHSDADCMSDGRSFETFIYIMPADMDMLAAMYREDFPDSALKVPSDALWPYAKGTLLGGFEGSDIGQWTVEGGSIAAYTPLASWAWVHHNGGQHLAEAITEGAGSAVVEIPAGGGEVVLSRSIRVDPAAAPLTHIGLDAINRTAEESAEKNVRMTMSVLDGKRVVARRDFELLERSNRRLLLPLEPITGPSDLTIELRIERRDSPRRVVLDNLRAFPGTEGG